MSSPTGGIGISSSFLVIYGISTTLWKKCFSGGARMRRRNGGHDYSTERNRVWFLVFGLHPLVFEQLPPNQHARLTARGFTNLRDGHDACASSFSKRSDRRAGCRRPSTRRVRRVNPLLYEVAVPVQPPALPRTAGPRITRSLKQFPPNRTSGGNFCW